MTHLLRKMKRIHFVGIGGIGMSGIAESLAAQGFEISGSDLNESSITAHLLECGCTVFTGHKPAHVTGANAVVYSSAVSAENPEIMEARRLGIPVIRRAEMLAELMRLKAGVGVAGTHGKTTTTSMIGHILTEAGLDPTVIVGGVMRGLGTNARLGASDILVAEADEYDRSFLKLTPVMAVLTTLEAEHLDTYGTYEALREAFLIFANSAPFYGLVAVCNDEPNLVDILPEIDRPVITYGANPHADLRISDIASGQMSACTVWRGKEELGRLELPLPGIHNLRNALGALAVAMELEVPFDVAAKALKEFSGVRRRFELRGEERGISVYDDYAHHPTEVRATLTAAREAFNGRRIVGVFQPHLYSRTQTFYREFAQALLQADVLMVCDVYPAREKPIEGITGQIIVDQAKKYGHRNVHYLRRREEIVHKLAPMLEEGDLVITLGAGDIYKTSDDLLKTLEETDEDDQHDPKRPYGVYRGEG